ncbi:hypothetical protein FB45DRAFT_1064462 [Roridomyces roridus]|uniref:Uncharacterized protein n=1 Tax=Roridomyces roridus TaxID=1738132 RepID=A0AAD7B9I5_9AGAR|nr:hypothetical protein FB45DRAFT_1064462 [Roridomyces roridus]
MPPLRRIPFTARNRPTLPKQVSADALDATKVALKAVRSAADACAPLKSGVSAALVLLEMSERMKQNKRDAETLARRAAQLMLDIWDQTKHLNVPMSDGVERSLVEIETLFRAIETLFSEIKKEKLLRRLIRQDRHKAQIEEYARLVDLATSQFSINLQLSIHTAQLSLRDAQVAHISADEKRHDDVLSVSQMSEAERLLLTSLHTKMHRAIIASGLLFFFIDPAGCRCCPIEECYLTTPVQPARGLPNRIIRCNPSGIGPMIDEWQVEVPYVLGNKSGNVM